MRAPRIRFCCALLPALLVVGCGPEPVLDGLFPPPAQNLMLFPPSHFGLEYQDITIDLDGGDTLYGWFIPAEDAAATVLIHHGAVFNRSALFGYYRTVYDLGYNVFVYDYRGFAESRVVPSLEHLLPDADAALEHIQGRSEAGTDRIVLFGISLGTLPTLAQAARTPNGIVGIILHGAFVSESIPPWSFPLLGVIPAPEVIDRVAAEHRKLDPYGNIEQITLPKLFIQSPQDLVTPFVGAELLYELAPEPKQLVEVFGGHSLPVLIEPNFAEHLRIFLDSVAPGEDAVDE